ncbi:MAG: SRPBCC family protein [Acidobacteria bacterium]|nr:SRPBCC family protein [Acidobacteriota bacterium]
MQARQGAANNKMNLKFVWKIPVDAPPEKLWRYIADTNRLNQYAGLPEFTFRYIPESDGGSRQVGETRYMGLTLRWDEHPFEWIEGQYYEIVRAYHNGPIKNFHTAVWLRPDNGGSLVEQTITCEPRWPFAIPAIYWEIGVSSRRRFQAAYRKIEKFLQGDSETPFVPVPRIAIPPGRLDVIRQRLANAGGRQWLPRLIEAIETLADEELDAMRPFVFADLWKAGRRDVLKLFLHASQAGLLDLSWDVICPGCRGARERHESLKKMRAEAHCPACNIRYTADFAESVELTFRPNPSIRRVEVVRYCSGGPMNAPHVVAQQQIAARTSKTLDMRLSPWKYHVRSLKLESQTFVQTLADAKSSSATIKIHRPTLEPLTLDLAPDVSLTLENNDDKDITVMIESVAGNENAATASMVIAMSEFRTLFSKEVLLPDTPISVGAVALMFTDLKASTTLYEKIGEAPAYGLVRRHFDLLRETIARSDGALVKTIGDSVMAAFFDPAKAVEAAFEMHRAINKDNAARGEPSLALKIGIHHGSCIAVNSNDILDYFGTAVNLAARVQKESQGGDIVVTEEIWQDPHVQGVLARHNFDDEVLNCSLRGLSGTRTVHRIRGKIPV